MNVEDNKPGFITLNLPSPEDRQGLVIPDYSEELSLGPMFSGLRRMGGQWPEEGNLLTKIFPNPGEEMAGAALTYWLAMQEQKSVSEMAPVMPFYADAYNEQLFDNLIRSNRQYYDAIKRRLDEIQESADGEDEDLMERQWRQEHRVLSAGLEFVHGASRIPLEPFISEWEKRTQDEDSSRPGLMDFKGLEDLAEMNPARPLFDATVRKDAEGNLGPNWEGLGMLAGGVAMARLMPTGGNRAFRERKIGDGARARMLMARDQVEFQTGAKYDPDTKMFYKNGRMLSDEELRSLMREKEARPRAEQEVGSEEAMPIDRAEALEGAAKAKPSRFPQERQAVEKEAIRHGLQDHIRIFDDLNAIKEPGDTAFKVTATMSPRTNAAYVPEQSAVYVLLDRLKGTSSVSRVLRHEALHVLFRNTLKAEYENIRHRARLMAENDPEWQRVKERYKDQNPDIVLEEYVVRLGEEGKNLPVRRAFVDELKRLARRRFGSDFELTDADVHEFLNDANRRIESKKVKSVRQAIQPKEVVSNREMDSNPYRGKNGRLNLGSRKDGDKDPKSIEAEREFIDILNNQELADRIYNSLPEARGGRVLSPDIAREIYEQYRTREGRIEYTIATGDAASVFMKDRLWRELISPGHRKELTFTAGGPGAGKTRAVDIALAKGAELTFDSTLRNTAWAKATIDLAIRNEWSVRIVYVQRPFIDVVKGVIQRADETGRWYPLRNLVDAHIDAQNSILKLIRDFEYDGDVRFEFLLSPWTKAVDPKLADIDFGGEWNYITKYGKGREGLVRSSDGEAARGMAKDALERGNRQTFLGAVRGKEIERRLLEFLARGDEELLGYIDQYYGPK